MTDTKEKEPVIRALRIIELLAANVIDGLSTKALSEALDALPSTITRDLDLLSRAGWVEQQPTGWYTLTTRPLAVAHACANAFEEKKNTVRAFFLRAQKEAAHVH